VFESRLSASVMTDVKNNLEETGEQIEGQIHERLTEYRNDLRFLHATASVSGPFRSSNNNVGNDTTGQTSYSQWKRRLETIFVAFLQNNIEYQQIRIIDTTEQGMELVRAARIGGEIKVIEQTYLQSNSDRDYFASSAQLSDGEVYMSGIALDRKFGEIEFPYRPMLHLSLPIFDEFGHRFGFLIVNIHTIKLQSSLESMVIPPNQLILTDRDGYFLITPYEKHIFSRDLDPTKTWNKSFYTLNQFSDDFSRILVIEDPHRYYFAMTQKIVVSGDADQGYLLVKLLTPQNDVNHLEMERRVSVYVFLAAVTAILIFVFGFFHRGTKKNQQLSEAKAKAESVAILDSSQDAIIVLSKEAVVTSWNSAAESLFNYREEDAKGEILTSLAHFQDVLLLDIINKLSQSDTQQYTDMTITKDQKLVYLSLSFSAITDFASDINGVVIIVRDVTHKHVLNMKIKQENATLEEKIASRTKELEKANYFKSTFILSISHEIHTSLINIIGTLQLVKNESLSNSQKRFLEMTEVSVNNLSALMSDVLDLSKIEAGKIDEDFQAFNPIKLIQNLSCTMAIKAQDKGLEFIVDVADLHCKYLISDGHRFSQILISLISNAINFTENGYIKVLASSQFCDDGHLILYCSVTDSGAGITENNKGKLFTAFAQEYTAVKSRYSLTGLGLPTSRKLVGLLNGDIEFTSIKNQGNTFSFSITVPQVDCKKMFLEPILKGKSCLILVPHAEQDLNIRRMFRSYSGEILEPKRYKEWLFHENNLCPDVIPDFIIIDQQDPKIINLDKKWSQWGDDITKTPKVFVLKKSRDTEITLKNISPVRLNKPFSISDLLQKAFTTGQKKNIKNQTSSKMKTEDDFKTLAENLLRITGARILVVDDNKINLEVVKGMLSSLPIEVEQAMNGQEALEILRKSVEQNHVFHCILMDCQMPILNGYDTSRQIRQGRVSEQYKIIPIIAVTANAMLGEREKCLAAGMNDYTTKPVNFDLLVSKIIEWILITYQSPLHTLPQIPESVAVNNTDIKWQDAKAMVVTHDILEWDKRAALTRLMNNEELLSKICQIFMDISPNKIKDLGQCIADKNFETIIKLAHSLKGSAGDLGAVYLHQLFSSMQQLAKSQQTEKIEECYQTVLTRYASFISILIKEQNKKL